MYETEFSESAYIILAILLQDVDGTGRDAWCFHDYSTKQPVKRKQS